MMFKFLTNKRRRSTLKRNVFETLDPSIKEIMGYCEKKRLEPVACCSGVLKDHKDEDRITDAYMLFLENEITLKIAAYFINSPVFRVSLCSKSSCARVLYGNVLYKHNKIAIYFENFDNENMKYISKVIKGITEDKIKVDKKNLQIVKRILATFSYDESKKISYDFNSIYCGCRRDALEISNLKDKVLKQVFIENRSNLF